MIRNNLNNNRYDIKINSLFICFLISISCSNLVANADDVQEIYANYSLEIIIFKYLDEKSGGTELFEKNITSIDPDKEIQDIEMFENNNSTQSLSGQSFINKEPREEEINNIEALPSDNQILFNIIPNKLLSLGTAHNRLNRIRVYQPIIWSGWKQILNTIELTPEVKLRRLQNTLGEFEGNFKFYKSNGGKLRLAVDVNMHKEQPIHPITLNKNLEEDTTQDLPSMTNIIPETLKYPLSDDKEIRLDEIRYFDHPKFGILAKVSEISPLNLKEKNTKIEIKPAAGNVFNEKLLKERKNYISAIERGIVGLGKTGKFISLILNKNGSFITHIADQLAIDKLNSNEVAYDTFIYSVNNGKIIEQNKLTIEIHGINDPPLSKDKKIVIGSNTYYDFSLDDFFFEDIEGNELSHIIITQLPKTGDLYLEYPFGIWGIKSGMHITKAEIPFLKYKPSLTENLNLMALTKDGNPIISIHFKVNDGEIDSKKENKFEFQFPVTKNPDNTENKNSLIKLKKYNNIIHLIRN